VRLVDRIRSPRASDGKQLPFDEWLSFFKFQGLDYSILNQTLAGIPQQEIPPAFYGFSEAAYKANGIVFACVAARLLLFAQARFLFRQKGAPGGGALTRGPGLEQLERPWPNARTTQLLSTLSLYADLAGNGYVWTDQDNPGALRMPRPDWMTIVLGNPREDGAVGDIDTEIAGYIYKPMGAGDPKPLLPEHVAHFAPLPDPIFPWRGMSWLQPIVEEVMGDNAANVHKRMFFEQGATANMVVNLGTGITPEDFDQWVEKYEEAHGGLYNAYKTLYLAGGADATVVGANMQQMDFRVVQAHGETRICLAARVPAIVVGVSEGLDSGTYQNFGQARRAFGDLTARPWWQTACETLEKLVDVPDGCELWYDEAGIPFLQEDQEQAAITQQANSAAIASLIMAGYDPDSVVQAIVSGDLSVLSHTGLFSVQLHPPGTTFEPSKTSPPATPAKNGNGKAAATQTG
jgi:phage portal protein BeeE